MLQIILILICSLIALHSALAMGEVVSTFFFLSKEGWEEECKGSKSSYKKIRAYAAIMAASYFGVVMIAVHLVKHIVTLY